MTEYSRRAFTFVATDPQGREIVIEILDGESWCELQTEDGKPVERIHRGRYHIIGTDFELTSDDPEAI
jgi:hypothetical protein